MYELFYNWLLPTSLAGALAVAVSLLLGPVLKKLRWRWRRAALASTFAFFLLPVGPLLALLPAARPAAPVGQPLAPVGEALGAAAQTAVKVVTVASLPPVTAPLAQPLPPVQPTLAEHALAAAPWLWLAGALLLTAWQIGRYLVFCRRLGRLCLPAPQEVQKLWQSMCAAKGVAPAPPLRCCPGLAGPVLTGLWRPALYLPEEMGGQSLELALRHELAHLGRADLFLKALVRFGCRLHWFNPLCHWQAARLARVCEYACDEQAVAGLDREQRKAYGRVLLSAAQPARLPAGVSGLGSSKKQIQGRLEALFAPARGSRAVCLAAALLLAAGLAFTACASAGLADGAASVQPPPASGSAKLPEQPLAAPQPGGTPVPTAAPSPDEAVPTPMPEPSDKPPLQEGEVQVRWTRWQEPVPYRIEYTLDETLGEGEEVVDRPGASGLRETSGWEFLDAKGSVVRTEAVGSIEIQPAVRQLMRGSDPKMAALYGENGSAWNVQPSTGTLLWPVPDYTYVSRWMGTTHKGADICANYGSAICAMDNATVVTADYHYSYGNYVILEHDNGYRTLYAHMSKLAVAVGDVVAQGQVIGYVGATGTATGNQCHVEVFVDGVRRSLKEWFPDQKSKEDRASAPTSTPVAVPTPLPTSTPPAG